MYGYSRVSQDAPWVLPLMGALLGGYIARLDGRPFERGFLAALLPGFALYFLTGWPFASMLVGVGAAFFGLMLYNALEDRPCRRGAKPPRDAGIPEAEYRRRWLRPPWSPFNRE